MSRTLLGLALIALTACSSPDSGDTRPAQADTSPTVADTAPPTGPSYSPYANRAFPENVYWGDTHLHTSVSLDAFGDGNTTVGPDEAYRWAKGETVASDDGMPTRISRPLDFMMVADHAEYLGSRTWPGA